MKRMLHSIRTHPTTRMTIAFATGILVPWYALLHYTTILEEQRAKKRQREEAELQELIDKLAKGKPRPDPWVSEQVWLQELMQEEEEEAAETEAEEQEAADQEPAEGPEEAAAGGEAGGEQGAEGAGAAVGWQEAGGAADQDAAEDGEATEEAKSSEHDGQGAEHVHHHAAETDVTLVL